jgi:putative DNA modification/repair radical SAM protein
MREAGLYADRLSVNIEIPTISGLKKLAPEKNHSDFIKPMNKVKNEIIQYNSEKKLIKSTPKYAPAGQSTQMIVGASGESDREIMLSANYYYKNYNMKRVYYSGYVPISNDPRLPSLGSQVPMLRENRLYQTDWLMRFYGFDVNELLNQQFPNLDVEVDPKLSWALRNQHQFPVDVNSAEKEMLLRIPGVGLKSAHKIVQARRFRKLNFDHLKAIGVALNRARYFIICNSRGWETRDLAPSKIKSLILRNSVGKFRKEYSSQLSLF